jgi:7-cyano-7-deazaguanine synthase
VLALSIIYGQKHIKELKAAKNIADYYGVDHKVLDLTPIFSESDCPLLSHSDKEIKHQSYAEQLKSIGGEGTVDTYVPFRNGLMLSAAASIALSAGASVIYYGAHSDDAAGNAYPDCTEQFIKAMNYAINEGSGKLLNLVAPLSRMNKAQVVKYGMGLDTPFELTWSCYEGNEKPCGTCGTCIDRAKAFELNGICDPALEVRK